ncbi:Flavin-binding monooxygenase [Mycena sanguinolenta]|uniref:Flavin-binding monooxygenase n=1 Tax=Mycena sanguinolenta TaxID=230812 RepID=A0A8H7CWY4_9AGAR|nr:Flavin-binding monooxygenase [Mycena sanguinolenta]
MLISPVPDIISAGFTFSCSIGSGKGYFSLVLTDPGEWKAVAVLMSLAEISGHEEWINEDGVYGGHTLAWTDVNTERCAAIEQNPHVLIVGGGQTGLNVAARFKHMNIPSLVVESNLRIGDNWRKRYPTLALHSPKKISEMSYQPFPITWPVFTPRDKIADWLESYVQSQDLVVWTDSRPLPNPTYDSATKRWTVIIERAGQHVTLTPAHIVVAAGALGAPKVPAIYNRDVFSGTIKHSSEYNGGKQFVGQRVVVVGTGNSAADICQDLSFNGAASVTMVQRSGTCVVACNTTRTLVECLYPDDIDVDVADFLMMAKPILLMQKAYGMMKEQFLEQENAMHQGLREAGLNLTTDKSIFWLFQQRYGGYWLDVGCAELIRSGKVKIKQGVEIAGFAENSVVFTDESFLEADAVIFATSSESIRDTMRGLFGDSTIDQTDAVWGLDEEGELKGVYRPSGHPGLWFAAGDFATSRFFSKQLALEIKAIDLGLLKL